jgi:NTE family protein
VLSGEGPACAANIGVLKALEQNLVPLDLIVGTNMGAVIGGSYASGMTVAELEAIFAATDWSEFLADGPIAYYLSGPCARARADGARCRGGAEASLLSTPDAVSGRNLDLLLQALIVRAPVQAVESFERLPIPFRVLATDVETFDTLVLTEGSLVSALRPMLVALDPAGVVRIDGRAIADVPGLTSSAALPVARDMGVDVLIVVNVRQGFEQQGGAIVDRESLLSGLLRGLSEVQTQESRTQLGFSDLVIDVDTYATTAGASADAAAYVNAGFEAVMGARLEGLAVSEQEYGAWVQAIRTRQ